jgi:ABC-type transporter Mla subunit MlaD
MNDEVKNNNSSSVLAKVLNQLNLPTLGLIMLMGGGNLFQGIQSSDSNHQEIERAIREVHQLYEKIDDTEERQQQGLTNLRTLIESNVKQVQNQNELLHSAHESLQNQKEMLALIRKTQKRFMEGKGLDEDNPPSF